MKNRLIMSEDKDAIIEMLIEKANERMIARLEYDEVEHLGLTNGMYEIILKDMENKGLLKRCGYSYYFEIRAEMHRIKEYGGYTTERDAYIEELKNIALQTEKLKKELSPNAMARINGLIEKAKNVTDLAASIAEISSILRQRNE